MKKVKTYIARGAKEAIKKFKKDIDKLREENYYEGSIYSIPVIVKKEEFEIGEMVAVEYEYTSFFGKKKRDFLLAQVLLLSEDMLMCNSSIYGVQWFYKKYIHKIINGR